MKQLTSKVRFNDCICCPYNTMDTKWSWKRFKYIHLFFCMYRKMKIIDIEKDIPLHLVFRNNSLSYIYLPTPFEIPKECPLPDYKEIERKE
jgi:hypothetical protein